MKARCQEFSAAWLCEGIYFSFSAVFASASALNCDHALCSKRRFRSILSGAALAVLDSLARGFRAHGARLRLRQGSVLFFRSLLPSTFAQTFRWAPNRTRRAERSAGPWCAFECRLFAAAL